MLVEQRGGVVLLAVVQRQQQVRVRDLVLGRHFDGAPACIDRLVDARLIAIDHSEVILHERGFVTGSEQLLELLAALFVETQVDQGGPEIVAGDRIARIKLDDPAPGLHGFFRQLLLLVGDCKHKPEPGIVRPDFERFLAEVGGFHRPAAGDCQCAQEIQRIRIPRVPLQQISILAFGLGKVALGGLFVSGAQPRIEAFPIQHRGPFLRFAAEDAAEPVHRLARLAGNMLKPVINRPCSIASAPSKSKILPSP